MAKNKKHLKIGDMVLHYDMWDQPQLGVIADTYKTLYDIIWFNMNWGKDVFISHDLALHYREQFLEWRKNEF